MLDKKDAHKIASRIIDEVYKEDSELECRAANSEAGWSLPKKETRMLHLAAKHLLIHISKMIDERRCKMTKLGLNEGSNVKKCIMWAGFAAGRIAVSCDTIGTQVLCLYKTKKMPRETMVMCAKLK